MSDVMARLDALARFTDEPGRLTRLYLSPAHRAAADAVRGWMDAAGLATRIDPLGTVIGRTEGRESGLPGLLIGSHIDTVRDAGRYDGSFGVIAGIACVAELARAGERLPFAIEVLAFGDEEGVRFPSTLSGSSAMAGTLDPAALDMRDGDGIALRDALRDFGCDSAAIAAAARRPDEVLAYLEPHIEQGPVLEAEGLPVGVVTAINGQSRYRLVAKGTAGHAGTVPMALRRDAAAGAAEMVLAIERLARGTPSLVATVGSLKIKPGAPNVIPRRAGFTLDIRSPDDAVRAAAIAWLMPELEAIAQRRSLTLAAERIYDAPAVRCDARMVDGLAAAVARAGIAPRLLPSGAGHDGMALAALCPIGMLFVRCRAGISHNPAESITGEDAEVAVGVLVDFVRGFDPRAFRHV